MRPLILGKWIILFGASWRMGVMMNAMIRGRWRGILNALADSILNRHTLHFTWVKWSVGRKRREGTQRNIADVMQEVGIETVGGAQ